VSLVLPDLNRDLEALLVQVVDQVVLADQVAGQLGRRRPSNAFFAWESIERPCLPISTMRSNHLVVHRGVVSGSGG